MNSFLSEPVTMLNANGPNIKSTSAPKDCAELFLPCLQVPISGAAAAAWSFITWFTDMDDGKSGKDQAAGGAKPSQFVKG